MSLQNIETRWTEESQELLENHPFFQNELDETWDFPIENFEEIEEEGISKSFLFLPFRIFDSIIERT